MNQNDKKKLKYYKVVVDTIRWEEGNRLIWIVSILVGIILSSRIAFIEETIPYFLQFSEIIMNILLALLAIQVGAYALFQALLNKELILLMYKKDNLLTLTNREFLGTILLYFYMIVFVVIIRLIFLPVPENFCLFSSLIVSELFALFLMTIFFTFSIRIILETKNFLINLNKVIVSNYSQIVLDNLKDNKEDK